LEEINMRFIHLIIERSILCSILTFALLCTQVSAQNENKERLFMAGAFASNITPKLGGMIVGGWQPIPATHVHDDLHARCLVLDNGITRLAFVVCDNVGLPRELYDAAKKQIHEDTNIPIENIMMSATHTHSAVKASGENAMVYYDELDEYQQFIVSRIVDGVKTAIHNMDRARIGWGSANEPSSVFNRRWFMNPDKPVPNPFGGVDQVQMNPPRQSEDLVKPAGPTDPEVVFMSIESVDGQPIALLAN
jgi:hypothetical protein